MTQQKMLTQGQQKHIKFTGYLQPSFPKSVPKPAVLYNKGGCDFRTAIQPAVGKQPISGKHLTSAGRPVFAQNKRFMEAKFRSPGPAYDPISSMGKPVNSQKFAAGGCKFGTSSRDGAMKLYAIYTTK